MKRTPITEDCTVLAPKLGNADRWVGFVERYERKRLTIKWRNGHEDTVIDEHDFYSFGYEVALNDTPELKRTPPPAMKWFKDMPHSDLRETLRAIEMGDADCFL